MGQDSEVSEGLQLVVWALGAALHLSFAIGLFAWARRVAGRRGGFFRVAQWAPLLGLAVSLGGGCWTSVALSRAFVDVARAPIEARSATLAQAIADAMWPTFFGLAAGLGLYVTSAVISTVGGRARGRLE
ncbi:MAG: hypothetical protein KF729_13675 [Sandaracinaceae bacterium]|nr:hypothetical protein [Sandaracinaceae bacterium]